MEKDMCRRQLSREGIGCVWVFMSMFDFRHGGSDQKLLMDKKRGSKRILGNNAMLETEQLTCDCEGMQSVKELIEEEIDEKTKQNCDCERSKTCSKTTDDHAEHSDDLCPRNSQTQVDSVEDDSEEKFSELIKRLISHKESETESCKNLVDDSKETLGSSQIIKEKIVILKPEPSSLDVGSSRGLDSSGHKAKRGRFGSGFLLSGIRRLKSAVGKNPCNTQNGYVPDPDANMTQNCCLEEDTEINSDRHVSDGEMVGNNKSMSGIYITAKKHLSEMLAESDVDMDLTDKESPRILGKILSRPEFCTPTSSPRLEEHDFVGHSQILVLDSNQHEVIASSTSDIPVSEDTEKEDEEKTVMDSLYEAIGSSLIQQDAYVNEDVHKQPLKKETFDDRHSPCSPPNASVRMSECQENATDVLGKSSPVSVLDPLFTDDDLSPNSSRFSSVERRMQPLCIRFDEPDSPKPEKESRMDDKELTLGYIQAVVESSDLNWEEVLARSFYSEQFLEQALMDETDFFPTKLCSDKKLLFDCINEVLTEFCGHGPWISFVKPEVRFENVAEVVQEEVYWHLLPFPCPHTLDQIVRKDLARTRNWMDLSFDIGCIGSETGERILDELLQEIISNYTELVQS